MAEAHDPTTAQHLPLFVTPPGETDVLFVAVVVIVVLMVFAIGALYFRLHALPEHIAHRGHKVQFEIVAVLALLALFTHNHLFWIAGLLLALVQLPDFTTPLARIAQSVEGLEKTQRLSMRGDQKTFELVPEARVVADAAHQDAKAG